MLVGRVVHDEVDDDLEPALLRLLHELDEVAERAVSWIDAVVVPDVVAVVAVGRRVERC